MPKAVSKKSSQKERPWPSTQQMLLDHLRRIVEGVALAEGTTESPDEIWFFGFGDDCLISIDKNSQQPGEDRYVREARIQMFFSCLAAETRDRPSGPGDEFIKRAAGLSGDKALATIFDKALRPPNHQFFRSVLPETADTETLQQVYAFEMLNKLGMVADRSKTEAVREILLLENVPERVDDYMAEATACFRYGFDKACLAVCRATLEQVLKWRMASDGKPAQNNLHKLIEDARKWNYLTGELARAAHDIREWGNGAVHDSQRGNIPIPRSAERRFLLALAEEALRNSKRILRRLCS